jgi:hypothetical protein
MQYSCTHRSATSPSKSMDSSSDGLASSPALGPFDAFSSTSNVLGAAVGVGSGDITTSAPPGHHAPSFTVGSRPRRIELGLSLRAHGGCRRQLTALTRRFKPHTTRVTPRLTSGRATW